MRSRLKRYQSEGHYHFLTFSCYRRLPYLNDDHSRTVFLHTGGAPALFAAGVGEWLRVKTVPAPRGALDRSH